MAKQMGWLEGFTGNINDAQVELEYLESQILMYMSEHGDALMAQ
jgi:hypothetical protein